MTCIFVSGKSIRDVWLKTILQVLDEGIEIKTEYDKPEDPPSKDATVMVEIKKPFLDPIRLKNKHIDKAIKIKTKYNKIAYAYGHPADLFLIESIRNGYIEEMVEGKMDHMIWKSETSFPYTYHNRIFNYTAFGKEDKNHSFLGATKKNNIISMDDMIAIGKKLIDLPVIDQIRHMIKQLKKAPYTRRAQGITWRPYSDLFRSDPPCLQRIWCRIIDGKLLMETTWRSRDLFKAWSVNVNAMIHLQQYMASKLEVEVGTYVDFSNSLHIYGSDFNNLYDMLVRIEKREGYTNENIELLRFVILKLGRYIKR